MSKPTIVQKSVIELIDKELNEGRGVEEIVDRFKNCVVARLLELTDGNQSQAAILGKTHRNNIVNWIHRYNLNPHYPQVQR